MKDIYFDGDSVKINIDESVIVGMYNSKEFTLTFSSTNGDNNVLKMLKNNINNINIYIEWLQSKSGEYLYYNLIKLLEIEENCIIDTKKLDQVENEEMNGTYSIFIFFNFRKFCKIKKLSV